MSTKLDRLYTDIHSAIVEHNCFAHTSSTNSKDRAVIHGLGKKLQDIKDDLDKLPQHLF